MLKKQFRLLNPDDPNFRTKKGQIVFAECRGLFGYKDFSLALNQNSDISILIAPNGFGKTTFLNLLNGLASLMPLNDSSNIDATMHPSFDQLSAIEKMTKIPFGLFCIVQFDTQYKVTSVFNGRYFEKYNVWPDISHMFYLIETVLPEKEPSLDSIDAALRQQAKKIEPLVRASALGRRSNKEDKALAIGSGLFYDLRPELRSRLKADKIEANKSAQTDSVMFFEEVLSAVAKYGRFDSEAKTLFSNDGFGDQHVKILCDQLSLWRSFGYIKLPNLEGYVGNPIKDEIKFVEENGDNLAKQITWAILRYCGYIHDYEEKAFLDDARSLFETISDNFEVSRQPESAYEDEFATLSKSFLRESEPFADSSDSIHTKAIAILLGKIAAFVKTVSMETLEKWILLIVTNRKTPLSQKNYGDTDFWWARKKDGEWVLNSFAEVNPLHILQKSWVQPVSVSTGKLSTESWEAVARFMDEPLQRRNNQEEIVLSEVEEEERTIDEGTRALYLCDAFGANCYCFLDFYRSIVHLEKAFLKVTGYKLGLISSSKSSSITELTFLKASDGTGDYSGKKLKRITKEMMSSGERAILAILCGCIEYPDNLFKKRGNATIHCFTSHDVFGAASKTQLTCILLDEPENSLHISWQERLLRAVKEEISNKNIQVIVATHSPSIISGNAAWLAEELTDE